MKAPALISRSSRPPLWREARIGLETAAPAARPGLPRRRRGRRPRPPGAADPGLHGRRRLAGDDGRLAQAHGLPARARGHARERRLLRAPIVTRLEERLERLVSEQGRRAVIVGQSRGGTIAKVLGCARPDLVCGIVRLGSPQLDPLAIHPLVRLQVRGGEPARLARRPRALQALVSRRRLLRTFWEDLGGSDAARRRAGVASTRSRTAWSTGAPASTRTPPRSRSAPRTAAWRCHPAAWRAVGDALNSLRPRRGRAGARAQGRRPPLSARRLTQASGAGTTTAAPLQVAGAEVVERLVRARRAGRSSPRSAPAPAGRARGTPRRRRA